jgi:hypothetical protein
MLPCAAMPDYEASFRVLLQTPIKISEPVLPELTAKGTGSVLRSIHLRPSIESGEASRFDVRVHYSDANISHATLPGKAAQDGVYVVAATGQLCAPWDAAQLISQTLYWMAARTLQAHIFWELTNSLERCVTDWRWKLPDGSTVPAAPRPYPGVVHKNLSGTGASAVSLLDWQATQDLFDGKASLSEPPLWRWILATAHREFRRDIRKAVIDCATALDVAAQRALPKGIAKFDMDVLRKKPLNMSGEDPALFATVSQLWYTRHGIVHRGEALLYKKNPMKAKSNIQLLPKHVEQFLVAVPKAIAFLEGKVTGKKAP